jgi:uncharacterized protein (TIGR03437 family)
VIQRESHPGLVVLLVCAAFFAGQPIQAQPPGFTYVTIPADSSIETDLMSTFPTGIFTVHNPLATPFSIPSAPGNCGPSSNAPCNYYRFGLTDKGASITIQTSVPNATDVFAIMNAYDPVEGEQLATIKFVGSAGASITFPLIGGKDIRDVHVSTWADTLANGVPGVLALNAFSCTVPTTCTDASGIGPPGNYFLDEQHYSLGSTFAGQTLTQIILTDTFNGSEPILIGLTVGSAELPAISASGVVNGASFQAGIVPGSWMTILGTNLAPKADSWDGAIKNGNLPTSLDGVKITVGGEPAYISYLSPTQINAVVPNVAAGTARVTVTNSIGDSATVNAVVQAVQPAFFQWGNYAAATTLDYSLAVKNGTFPGVTTTPAKPGEVIVLWGTGFGPTSPSAPDGVETPSGTTYNTADTVSVKVGGETATVYGAALAPGFAGLYQVAIQIPASLTDGDYPVVATISNAQSPSTVLITVQK